MTAYPIRTELITAAAVAQSPIRPACASGMRRCNERAWGVRVSAICNDRAWEEVRRSCVEGRTEVNGAGDISLRWNEMDDIVTEENVPPVRGIGYGQLRVLVETPVIPACRPPVHPVEMFMHLPVRSSGAR